MRRVNAKAGNTKTKEVYQSTMSSQSASLPPGFPLAQVNGSSYWDGGPYSNTPLSEAINCLERCADGSREVKREIIVAELVPRQGEKADNMEQVISRFYNMIFASKLELDRKLFSPVTSIFSSER